MCTFESRQARKLDHSNVACSMLYITQAIDFDRSEMARMPIPSDTRRLPRSLARDEVYRTLHGWIVDGTLAPGEQLRDAELAELLGVSRTPVREALLRLDDEGLVETQRNRWTRVAPITAADVHRHFPIVWALERLALELHEAQPAASELEQLRALNAQLAAAVQRGDAPAAQSANDAWHELLIAGCPNAEVRAILGEQRARLRRFARLYFGGSTLAEQALQEHARVIDLLERGERAAAAAALEDHLKQTYQRQLCQLATLGLTAPTEASAPCPPQ